MNKTKILSFGLLFGFILFIVGCGEVQVAQQTALNFTYESKNPAGSKSSKKILLLTPEISLKINENDNEVAKYVRNFKDSFTQTLEKLFEHQGYQIIEIDGVERDDIPFKERKEGYIIVSIKGDIEMGGPITKLSRGNNPLDDMSRNAKGIYTALGNVKIKFLEPLSGQVMDTLNINTSQFNIKVPYEISIEGNASTMLLPKGWGTPDVKDNHLDSLRKALNELWVKMFSKIDNKIVYQTINAYEKDIKDIKSNKRF